MFLSITRIKQKVKVGSVRFRKMFSELVEVSRTSSNQFVLLWSHQIIENELTQMTLQESERKNLNLTIGEFYKQSLPPIDFGRIAAQTAKQVISQKVREAERQRQYHEYKDRVGEIVVGTIKRVENSLNYN